jgi:hypothetical protein
MQREESSVERVTLEEYRIANPRVKINFKKTRWSN